jgi:energy-converting hydrogenase Eha subunit E
MELGLLSSAALSCESILRADCAENVPSLLSSIGIVPGSPSPDPVCRFVQRLLPSIRVRLIYMVNHHYLYWAA